MFCRLRIRGWLWFVPVVLALYGFLWLCLEVKV
jgi:hypothetical protein